MNHPIQLPGAPDGATDEQHDDLMTYDQVAKDFRIPRGTLFYWVSRKSIPHIRLAPRTVRFRRSELRRWLDARTVDSSTHVGGAA